MTQKDKTKEDFIEEINSLKKRIAELENADSDRKQQQQQQQIDAGLQKSGVELRAILDSTPFPVALVDIQDNKINFWSRSATTLFGHIAYTTTEWYQLAYPDPDYRRKVLARWKPALEKAKLTGQPVNAGEYQVTCRDGSMRICELYATFLADKLIVTFSDITERNTVEDALRESEIHYRELVQNANSIIIRWRRDGTISFCNEYALKFFGYTLNEVIGKDINILLPQKETTGRDLSSLVKNIIDQPDQYINNINENICRDGLRVWVAWTNKAVFNDQMQVEEILCIGSDITESKKMSEELQESERQWGTTFNAISDSICLIEPDGKILKCNQATERLLGKSASELNGKFCYEIVHGLSQPIADCPILRMKETKNKESMLLQLGKQWVEVTADPVLDKEQRIVAAVHIIQDITERKNMEEATKNRLHELEVFHKVAMGREERIIELKKEIEYLKKKLVK